MSRYFCDSNSEIPFARFKDLGATLIRMPYTVNGEEHFYDLGENTDTKAFFDGMRACAVVKTQALNSYDYMQYFEPVLAAGEDILYVTFSHAMSGTFAAMQTAIDELKEKYPTRTITTVDTYGISMGAGMVAYHAAIKHNAGASDAEVVRYVEDLRKKVACYFTVADLEYLKRGGRLSSFKAAMGTLFNLKPIIMTNADGALVNTEKVKGRKKSLHRLVEFMDEGEIDESYPAVIMNADADEDAQYVADLIGEKHPGVEIWMQPVGPVVGCHCGPETIGLIFVRK